MVFSETVHFDSCGVWFSLNITEILRRAVERSRIHNGILLVFFQHTTGGVIVVEHEAGFLVDLEDTLERLIPSSSNYLHHLRGYDVNGAAHVRTALVSPYAALPVVNGDLALGEWQDVVVVDMQPERKQRSFLIQVVGE
ncbi:MAG: YjbQ family protein [Anaerolineae bacterium]|nr:YjbQ family protein [Anaerolineae bacterium]